MKFLAFIMAFLVLSLSIMPCTDSENFNGDKNELTKSTQQNDNQQDDCSPFCTCTCCAGFSINHCIAAINVISPYKSNLVIGLLSSQTTDVALPIWQPPQLV